MQRLREEFPGFEPCVMYCSSIIWV